MGAEDKRMFTQEKSGKPFLSPPHTESFSRFADCFLWQDIKAKTLELMPSFEYSFSSENRTNEDVQVSLKSLFPCQFEDVKGYFEI